MLTKTIRSCLTATRLQWATRSNCFLRETRRLATAPVARSRSLARTAEPASARGARSSEGQGPASGRALHPTKPTHQAVNLRRRETRLRRRYSAGKRVARTRMTARTRKEDRASKIHLPRTTSSGRATRAGSTRSSDQFSSKVRRNTRLLQSAVIKAHNQKFILRIIKSTTTKSAEANRPRSGRAAIPNRISTTRKTFQILSSRKAWACLLRETKEQRAH